MTETNDSRFKTFEHSGWQNIPKQYNESFGGLTIQCIPALLDAVGVEEGTRLLDVCTGPGFAAAAAAECGAEATGLDFSSEMLSVAREQNPAVEFREGDAEDLPFPNEQFDAVVMNFGLLHMANPEKALAEACRVLRSGGKIASTVWATADRAIGFGIVLVAIQTHGRTDVDLPPAPDFFRFSDAEACHEAFSNAGFQAPIVEEVPQIWRMATADYVFDSMQESTVRTAGLLRVQTDDALSSIRTAIRESVMTFQVAGGFELPMPAVMTSATKP